MIRLDEFSNMRLANNSSSVSPPFLLTVRVMERCTVKCKMCDFWKHPEIVMPFDNLKKIIDDAYFAGVKEICFTGGEPTAYPEFFEAVSYLKSRGLRYSFITNGSKLKEDFVKNLMILPPERIHISIDSPIKEIHDDIRGSVGLFETALNGIKLLNNYHNRPKIIINTVLSKQTYADVPELIKLSEGRYFEEVNLMQIKGMPTWMLSEKEIYTYNSQIVPFIISASVENNVKIRSGSPYIFGTSDKQINDSLEGNYSKEFYTKHPCHITKSMLFVETNGEVYPCNNTPYYKAKFGCGNIFTQSLLEIIKSERMAFVKQKMCGSALCASCDPINQVINLGQAEDIFPVKLKEVAK